LVLAAAAVSWACSCLASSAVTRPIDEVERADEAVGDAVAAGAHDGVAQRHRPVVLEQDERRRRVVRDLLEHWSKPSTIS
jgi:hypothetical protein